MKNQLKNIDDEIISYIEFIKLIKGMNFVSSKFEFIEKEKEIINELWKILCENSNDKTCYLHILEDALNSIIGLPFKNQAFADFSKKFSVLRTNRLHHSNFLSKTPSKSSLNEFNFTPHVSKTSRKIASAARKKIIDRNEIPNNLSSSLSTPDLFNFQQSIHNEYFFNIRFCLVKYQKRYKVSI